MRVRERGKISAAMKTLAQCDASDKHKLLLADYYNGLHALSNEFSYNCSSCRSFHKDSNKTDIAENVRLIALININEGFTNVMTSYFHNKCVCSKITLYNDKGDW